MPESLFDKFIIGSAADSLKISDPLSAYSRVTLKVADGVEYTAGTDSGKELISENPFGTQKMANDMLTRINGYSYQTYTAKGAILLETRFRLMEPMAAFTACQSPTGK